MKQSPSLTKRYCKIRQAIPVNTILEKRLLAYVSCASAAGVGLLALTHPAEAKIIYTPAHVVMTPSFGGNTYPLDLNHDKKVDFSFDASEFAHQTSAVFMDVRPATGVWGSTKPRPQAAALRPGIQVGPGGKFIAGSYSNALMGGWDNCVRTSNSVCKTYGNVYTGPWANGGNGEKDRYLGLRFSINGQTHYGWARFNFSIKKGHLRAVLTGYAYETIANKPIVTGKTKGPDVVLQPATLGNLARGASGLKVSARH